MPTDLFSAIVYVFLLVPGIVYVRQIERHRVTGESSVFRETATVIVASSATMIATWIVAVFLTVFPALRRWISALLSNPSGVQEERPLLYSSMLILALAVSVAIAYVAGLPWVQNKLLTFEPEVDEMKLNTSAWSLLFDKNESEGPLIVSVQLKNGDWIQGPLQYWNPSPKESSDRSFVLYGPIWFRSSEADEEELLNVEQAFIISAAEISHLSVTMDPDKIYQRDADSRLKQLKNMGRTDEGGLRMWVHRVSTRLANATKPSDSTK